MNIFDDNEYQKFDTVLRNIDKQFNDILLVFNNDAHEYLRNTTTPFDICVEVQVALDYINDNYISLANQVEKVFKSTRALDSVSDDFIKYHTLLKEIISKKNLTNKDKTMGMALAMIFICNSRKTTANKRSIAILRSMCVFPEVGTLVQVSSSVIEEL